MQNANQAAFIIHIKFQISPTHLTILRWEFSMIMSGLGVIGVYLIRRTPRTRISA